jgi:hypothetical protein
MITKEKILKRPERLEGLPEQARHVSSYHLYEDEARELTLYFEDRLPTIGMRVDEPPKEKK